MTNIDQELRDRVNQSLVAGKLPCAVALRLAADMGLKPKEIGAAANEMDVKIATCQLGCFP